MVPSQKDETFWLSKKTFGEPKATYYDLKLKNNSVEVTTPTDDFKIVSYNHVSELFFFVLDFFYFAFFIQQCLIIQDEKSKVINRFMSTIKTFNSVHLKPVSSGSGLCLLNNFF